MPGIQPGKENNTRRAAYSRRAPRDDGFLVSVFLLRLPAYAGRICAPHGAHAFHKLAAQAASTIATIAEARFGCRWLARQIEGDDVNHALLTLLRQVRDAWSRAGASGATRPSR